MRIRATKRQQPLSIKLGIDFARIVGQTMDETTYEFLYTIDRPNILNAGAVSLEFAIIEKPETQKMRLFTPSLGMLAASPQTMTKNILIKNATDLSLTTADKNVLMKTDVDFTAFISNDQTDRGEHTQTTTKYATVASLSKQAKFSQHIPSTAPHQPVDKSPTAYTPQALKLISKGIDPTSVVVNKPTSQVDLFNGTKQLTANNKKLALYSALVTQPTMHRKKLASAASSDAKVILREALSSRTSRGKKTVVIMNAILGTKTVFYLRVRLMGPNRAIIGEITRKVEHAKLLNKYLTPTIAPAVSTAKAMISGRNVLHITQRDPVAAGVRVFRKVMHSDSMHNGYKPIGTFVATKRLGTITVRDDVDNSKTIIYRVIPLGKNETMSSIFTNVIAPPVKRPFVDKRFSDDRANITITALYINDAIQLHAHNFHDDVVAVQFMRKNISMHETQWKTVNNDLLHRADSGGDVTSIDADLQPSQIFEYTARLTFRTGTVQIANAITTIQHISLKRSQVQVTTTSPVITHKDGTNITFDMVVNVNDSMLSIAKTIIERKGYVHFFAKELADERALLSRMVVTHAERIDLDRGDVENMGIITGDLFDDNVQSRLVAAQPLRRAGRYRYVFYTYQRDLETIFDDLVKTSTVRGRSYTYRPAKYKSPAAMQRSTIVTRGSRGRTSIPESLILGDLVNVTKTDVVMHADQPSIIAGTIDTTTRGNTIRWTTRGNTNLIDHFIVFARRFETTEPIATIHAQNVKNAGTFMHNDDNGHDVDSYEVVAVFHDYKTDLPFVVRQNRSA